jgi:nucleotide-binding universal stress UspA family protein
MKIRELLFPTDFSPASEAAGRVARETALAEGARLRLVHVLTPLTDPAAAARRLTQLVATLGQGLAVETEQKLDADRAGRRGAPA